MSLWEILVVAVGLSMDAVAVSLAASASQRARGARATFRLSFHFGLFQFLMPVAGWFIGASVARYIESVDHWIAFGLLAFIGGKMVWDGIKGADEGDNLITIPIALTLAVATSIDALMVGLSFAFLETSILFPIIVIGLVTFVLSLLGFVFGSVIGKFLGGKIRIVGGVILIAIGLRILAEHLSQ